MDENKVPRPKVTLMLICLASEQPCVEVSATFLLYVSKPHREEVRINFTRLLVKLGDLHFAFKDFIGYAVKNAISDVKAVADKITDVDNNNDAIAWIINDLEKEGI